MSIQLLGITFKQDKAQIDVKFDQCLTPEERIGLRDALYKKYPNIKNHACKNSKGPRFDDCVETTSIAHIFEHVILEELAFVETREGRSVSLRNALDKPESRPTSLYSLDKAMRTFVAKTTNLGEGLAKIEMKYYDDISTLQAINKATSSLNEMLLACKM